MSNNNSNETKIRISYKAIGMGIGLIFGGLVGLLIDNLIIFAGGGMVVGLAIGTALDSRLYKENS
jgi:uncharacterized membrane protein